MPELLTECVLLECVGERVVASLNVLVVTTMLGTWWAGGEGKHADWLDVRDHSLAEPHRSVRSVWGLGKEGC